MRALDAEVVPVGMAVSGAIVVAAVEILADTVGIAHADRAQERRLTVDCARQLFPRNRQRCRRARVETFDHAATPVVRCSSWNSTSAAAICPNCQPQQPHTRFCAFMRASPHDSHVVQRA